MPGAGSIGTSFLLKVFWIFKLYYFIGVCFCERLFNRGLRGDRAKIDITSSDESASWAAGILT